MESLLLETDCPALGPEKQVGLFLLVSILPMHSDITIDKMSRVTLIYVLNTCELARRLIAFKWLLTSVTNKDILVM